jgi:flagellar motor switch protein FliM
MPNNSSSPASPHQFRPSSHQATRPHQVLDPRLLGRPVHLLPRFAARFADQLGALLATPGARRYWGGFMIDSASFRRAGSDLPARWLGMRSSAGALALAFERSLLMALLEARYGGKGAPVVLRAPADERVSATEERMAATLARQLGDALAASLGLRLDPAAPHGSPAPAATGWVLEVLLRQPQASDGARCYIALDQALMGLILESLAPQRNAARKLRAEPLTSSVKVKLDGRLLSKEITLEALFSLKVGDVIPVSVDRADVVLDEARLFTAAVAEHKGKLCLTSFEDAE